VTFTRRLSTIFPGFGQPQLNDTMFLNQSLALSGTGQQTSIVPSTTSVTFSPTISAGKMRIKISAGAGTSPTLTDILVTASDGTTTVTFANGVFHPNTAVALSTTSIVEFEFDFICDLNLTSFTIKTTMGGTSPTATMDVEVLGTI
jgi:hypothetical protein